MTNWLKALNGSKYFTKFTLRKDIPAFGFTRAYYQEMT